MNIALIVAGGKGERLGFNIPKQFCLINDKPLIAYTLEKFQECSCIDSILIAVKSDYKLEVESICKKYGFSKVSFILDGGSTRQESVYNGLKYLEKEGINSNSLVLIHDAVRPFVTTSIIEQNISSAKLHEAVTTAMGSTDTIIRSNNGTKIDYFEDRKKIYQVQTPQTFKFDLILTAHEKALKEKKSNYTDDCSLVLELNKDICIVLGSENNIKITRPIDLELAKLLLK